MTKTEDVKQERQVLSFESDRGASRSIWVAAGILVAIVAWMGSGFILPSEDGASPDAAAEDPAPVAVAIRKSQAEAVTLFFQAEGQAQPDRDTAIRAEASGDVAEVLVEKGSDVSQGDIIARLASDRVEADLNRALEEQSRAQREFDNASELLERGVGTQDRLSQAQATLASAKAAVTAAQEALDSTNVVAPFDGRIETLSLDAGEYISAGSDIGRIVDNRPLTVTLQVPQQALRRIQNGQKADVSFITGEEREGRVTFVGTSASAETRTFLAEIEVDNEDGAIPAGISAEIRIPTGERQAHFISPSVVSLAPDGVTGVKTVEDGVVVFHEIEVVRAEVDGIWVTGLPEEARIITIGQGFVRNGETVEARPELTAEADAEQAAETQQ
ncbi:Toluene efflux pump periplasmic linker protein TtgD precursor [Sulfitobacter sp. THAF37]|uniref:efflux RND transporter periplasmic adaptor subunit n=1 Tax=Sulfitobacter sp. THAF37 TaxID=2587855 RepID=UPI0012689AA2|nr:efflux RND transporter periplasmic adaptor subunit [Sulfitobacter sp. THAF37]QFT59227.1 Toluene efflux pump periplasmic linker protein TtgD precursor [Sulfitobacter sp. THAF37]